MQNHSDIRENFPAAARYDAESVYFPRPAKNHLLVYAAICVAGAVLFAFGLHFYWVCYHAYLSCIDESRALAAEHVSAFSAISILTSSCASIGIVDFVIFALVIGTPVTYFAALMLIFQTISTLRRVPRITLDISGVTVNTLFGSNAERWTNLGPFTLLDDSGSLIEAPITLAGAERTAKMPEAMTIKTSAIDVSPAALLLELNRRRAQAIDPGSFASVPQQEAPRRSFGRRVIDE